MMSAGEFIKDAKCGATEFASAPNGANLPPPLPSLPPWLLSMGDLACKLHSCYIQMATLQITTIWQSVARTTINRDLSHCLWFRNKCGMWMASLFDSRFSLSTDDKIHIVFHLFHFDCVIIVLVFICLFHFEEYQWCLHWGEDLLPSLVGTLSWNTSNHLDPNQTPQSPWQRKVCWTIKEVWLAVVTLCSQRK